MKNPLSDTITPQQCKAARALLNLTQPQLAEAAGVSNGTIVSFEKGNRETSLGSVTLIRLALERGGIVFIPENGGGLGVRLRDRRDGEPAAHH